MLYRASVQCGSLKRKLDNKEVESLISKGGIRHILDGSPVCHVHTLKFQKTMEASKVILFTLTAWFSRASPSIRTFRIFLKHSENGHK